MREEAARGPFFREHLLWLALGTRYSLSVVFVIPKVVIVVFFILFLGEREAPRG